VLWRSHCRTIRCLVKLAEEFTQKSTWRGKTCRDVEEYASRYPELAGRIRELFPTLMLLEGMAATGYFCYNRKDPHLRFLRALSSALPRRPGGLAGAAWELVYEASMFCSKKGVSVEKCCGPDALTVRGKAPRALLPRSQDSAGLHHTNIVPVFDVGQVFRNTLFCHAIHRGAASLDRILGTPAIGRRRWLFRWAYVQIAHRATSDMPGRPLSLEASPPKVERDQERTELVLVRLVRNSRWAASPVG